MVAPVGVVFKTTATLLAPLVYAKSGFPSPLKSPTAGSEKESALRSTHVWVNEGTVAPAGV